MKYIKTFDTHSEYQTYSLSSEFITPNVSFCKDNTDEVHYSPYVKPYDQQYLTFEALESGTFTVRLSGFEDEGATLTSLSYSLDNGDTWTTSTTIETFKDEISIELETTEISANDTVLFKGVGSNLNATFTTNTAYNASGNPMSLFYGDDFRNVTELWDDCFRKMFAHSPIVSAENVYLGFTTLASNCYNGMFSGCTSLTTAPVLPATTLAGACYISMFAGCTGLTTAPALPATTLAEGCYESMFQGCTGITSVPSNYLPVTTLANYCYNSMFQGCTSLTTAPELPATTLVNSCYYYMFKGCTALTTAPVLNATTLANSCYYGMFQGCTSLTTAPVLPATTLVNSCYYSMFNGCTSLTTAPVLNATTLTEYCYRSMFQGCTSLTTAPELPATTLVSNCYNQMFYGCSNLNYIKAMFTTTPSTAYTNSWVQGVAATGTFVKNSDATWNVTGVNGVPSGWTVQTATVEAK